MAHRKPLEEPDVTPLINVNLVILVMTLAIASHAAKLLPLAVPKADKPTAVVDVKKTVVLSISATNTFGLDGATDLTMDELSARLAKMPEGRIVLVSASPKSKYESLVKVVDRLLERGDLRVAFGHLSGAIAVTAAPAGGGS